MARRVDGGPDRRFSPMVLYGKQCNSAAIIGGGGLCSTCLGHSTKYQRGEDYLNTWHGRVDESLDAMPASSHIAGGPWWTKRMKAGTIFFWPHDPRPETARQEGRLKKRPTVPEAAIQRFIRRIDNINIESLSQRNQLQSTDLCRILVGIERSMGRAVQAIPRRVWNKSKLQLCAEIRNRMDPGFFEPAPKAKKITKTKKTKKTVMWSLVPYLAPVQFRTRYHVVNGTHILEGGIKDEDQVIHNSLSAFAIASIRRINASESRQYCEHSNGWHSVWFLDAESWRTFDSIRYYKEDETDWEEYIKSEAAQDSEPAEEGFFAS
jgi:hypothetical protein